MMSVVMFLLVHSPALGPSSWRWVVSALENRGAGVVVPDLTGAVSRCDPEDFAGSAAVEIDDAADPTVIVGHSGAGVFLPAIVELLASQQVASVYVDAGLPTGDGAVRVGGDFLPSLRDLADADGLLPPWSEWFGTDLMEQLVADHGRRVVIETDQPRVPLDFYESRIMLPPRWRERPGAFVLLSEAYQHDAERAVELGWTVFEHLGRHLDIVDNPDVVARALIDVTALLTR